MFNRDKTLRTAEVSAVNVILSKKLQVSTVYRLAIEYADESRERTQRPRTLFLKLCREPQNAHRPKSIPVAEGGESKISKWLSSLRNKPFLVRSINMTGPFGSELAAVRAGFKAIMADNNKQQYKEFGFWVIMKNKADKSGVDFFYTEIVDGGSGEVSMTLPHEMVRANCHTHPKRYTTGNFSTNDRKNFMMLRNKQHPMPFYLLTPSGMISVAREEKHFPRGEDVPWS